MRLWSYKVILIIRKAIRTIEIDQYYTNNGNANSSNIRKNGINT